MSELNLYAPWFAVAVAIASFVYSVINNRSKDTESKFTQIDEKIATKADAGTVAALIGKVDLAEDRVTRIEV
jgi:hypothetical protein